MDDNQPINIGPDGVPEPPSSVSAEAHPHSARQLIGRRKRRMMPAFWYRWDRKTKILSSSAVVLVLAAATAAVYTNFINKSHGATQVTQNAHKVAKPTTVASPLSGVQVSPEQAKRPVTGIMIENSPDARPQSGLQNAGVVFEAIAEGGITRFLALFQEGQPPYVGPVRSLRTYYIDWAGSFDAPIAHVGGSPTALDRIRTGGKDLDQFFNANSYFRVNSRRGPHDVYTGFDKLDALNNSKGYTASKFDSWPRKADAPSANGAAKVIDVGISSALYNSHYNYDGNSNTYLRSEGDLPHIVTAAEDGSGSLQLQPKVLVILVMGFSIVDSDGHGGYDTIGSGPVYVFQDGGVTNGTWTKASPPSQFLFKDTSGQPINLNAGQTWVTVAQDGQLHYSP
ncbi:hypothetical protein BVY00_01040 [bacterium G20]|nr:hypothetical protein BVY00_01040 [bacterium G20]